MTKKLHLFLTSCFAIWSIVSIAQPTLTATGMNYVVGESFTLKGAPYLAPGNSGANQTWDLSSMSGTSGGLTSVVSPSTTTNGSLFTNANVALSNTTAGTVAYYKTSSTAIQNVGTVGGSASTVFKYSDVEDLLHFPFTYSATYDDYWAATFSSAGYDYFRTGITTVTADGYGTLITPDGTYTNVMRVHFEQLYQDSTDLGGFPFVISYYNDQYMWYKDGVHSPIAAVYELESDISAPFSGGFYIAGASSGLAQTKANNDGIKVSPNPANDLVTFGFNMNSNEAVSIMVFNAMGQMTEIGQTFNSNKGNNQIQLNVENLPQGIYFAHIVCKGEMISTQRFVVAR